MACSSCGKKSTKKVYAVPALKTVNPVYVEGTNGYTGLTYTGIGRLKVRGCKTGSLYAFENGVNRVIDSNDVECLLEKYAGLFDVKSNNSQPESESASNAESVTKQYADFFNAS